MGTSSRWPTVGTPKFGVHPTVHSLGGAPGTFPGAVVRMGRMPAAHAYVERNTHERERLRGLVARLTDDDLRRPVTDRWTVADMLGHLAFWDARALSLAEKLEAGVPFVPADHEPED